MAGWTPYCLGLPSVKDSLLKFSFAGCWECCSPRDASCLLVCLAGWTRYCLGLLTVKDSLLFRTPYCLVLPAVGSAVVQEMPVSSFVRLAGLSGAAAVALGKQTFFCIKNPYLLRGNLYIMRPKKPPKPVSKARLRILEL